MKMARQLNQQEVILTTGSQFAGRQQYQEKDTSQPNASLEEKFREACWNGMLKEILPEVFLLSEEPSKLFLWQMREARHVLALQMAEYPTDVDQVNSIDPYCFVEILEMN